MGSGTPTPHTSTMVHTRWTSSVVTLFNRQAPPSTACRSPHCPCIAKPANGLQAHSAWL